MSLADGVIRTAAGFVAGVTSPDGAVRAFKGIPYAKPPVGDLRWRPPQPVTPWDGTRAADKYGPRSFQPERAATSIGYFGPEAQSEDCLYLNLWTAARSEAEKRPVMVWIHGGAFYLGSGGLALFNGEQLARHGVVLVTMNYRLGPAGFLAHPELTQESEHNASGNYGLMDQVAVLRWVQDNVAAFGGDPDCVTIFGQSAGSFSVSCHMTSPLSKGLFHRAIGQSGAAFGPVATTSDSGDSTQTLAAAEQTGLAYAAALGAKSLAELRARPVEEIQFHRPPAATGPGGVSDPSQVARGAFDTAYAITDGYVLPTDSFTIFNEGRQNDVPLMTGSTANEGGTMPAAKDAETFLRQSRAEYGDLAEDFLRHHAATNDARARDASRRAIGHRNFIWQNWTWARLQAQTGKSPVYYYQFHHAPPIAPDANYLENPADKFGAFHTAEIAYIYRNLGVRKWPWTDQDRKLSDVISSYWVNFARTGNPNGEGLPSWPQFTGPESPMMNFAGEAATAPVPDRAVLDFWEQWYARQRAAMAK